MAGPVIIASRICAESIWFCERPATCAPITMAQLIANARPKKMMDLLVVDITHPRCCYCLPSSMFR
jgi:hypothetical protein